MEYLKTIIILQGKVDRLEHELEDLKHELEQLGIQYRKSQVDESQPPF